MTEDMNEDMNGQQSRDVTQRAQGLGYPTEELPTYRKVASHPEPAPTTSSPWDGTGELPVTGTPVTTTPEIVRPRGPHLPTVVSGVVILALATIAFVWRLVDQPNWAVVGISIGVAAGAMFLLAAMVSFVAQHARKQRDFDRMLSGS